MDTQKNDGKTDADSVGAGGGSNLPKISASDIVAKPSALPANPPSNIEKELPDNIPFIDNMKEDIKRPDVLQNKINPSAKIVPGARGPLPSTPAKIMKTSEAKFGIGTPLRSLSANGSVNKIEQGSANQIKQNLSVSNDEKLNNPIMPKPKIGVPLPPKMPDVSVSTKATPKGQYEEKASGSIVLPDTQKTQVASESVNVDKNIRPRRLAIVVITLVVIVAAIIFSVWFFLMRNGTTTTQPVDQLLSSASPTSDVMESTPSASSSLQQDTDGDGLTDAEEQQLGTDQLKADTDGDEYSDKQELDAGYDPLTVGGKLDSDRDGLADPDEKCWGTDSHNPDTDGDGYLDGQEVVNGHDPLIPSPNDKLTTSAKCSF